MHGESVSSFLLDMGKSDTDFSKIIAAVGDCNDVKLILNSFTINPLKRVIDLTPNDVTTNITTNLTSQIKLVVAFTSASKKQGFRPRIININSGAAEKALNGWSLYSGAKAYLNMFLRTLCQEENVDVVSYDPGVVDTEMQEVIRSADKKVFDKVDMFIDYKNSDVLLDPADVAHDIFHRFILDWNTDKFFERYLVK